MLNNPYTPEKAHYNSLTDFKTELERNKQTISSFTGYELICKYKDRFVVYGLYDRTLTVQIIKRSK